MESLVYFIISHSQMVLITLVGSIILCVFGLLLISFHHPQDAVANELGGVDRIEGVLRQILSEQDWPSAKAAEGTPASVPGVSATEEVGDPLPPAAPSEASPGDTVASPAEDSAAAVADSPAIDAAPVAKEETASPASADPALKNKIKELEEKLAEYSVIEEDIADLSRFRQENDDLKKKITRATGVSAEEAASMPWDDFEKVVQEKNTAPAKDAVATTIDPTPE
jgi:hypothetical protein